MIKLRKQIKSVTVDANKNKRMLHLNSYSTITGKNQLGNPNWSHFSKPCVNCVEPLCGTLTWNLEPQNFRKDDLPLLGTLFLNLDLELLHGTSTSWNLCLKLWNVLDLYLKLFLGTWEPHATFIWNLETAGTFAWNPLLLGTFTWNLLLRTWEPLGAFTRNPYLEPRNLRKLCLEPLY